MSGKLLDGPSQLTALLSPRGVVVIGASTEPSKLGAVMAASLSSFSGHVALVNPRGGPGFHANVSSASTAAPQGLDLAILCVPAQACAAVLRECGEAGIGAALVCAGGFAESGEEGAAHQAELLAAAEEWGIRLLGPNTSGFFVPRSGLSASFVPGVADVRDGRIGLVAASGGLNHALAFALERQGLGLSIGVGIGAGIDVDSADVVTHLAHDEQTTAIVLHIETVRDGAGLLAAVRAASTRKPVIVLVVGQHDVGDFAASHTGALATSWRTTRALLRQAGAVIVDDEQELVTAAAALSLCRLAPALDPGIALITGQAGPGLVIADALFDKGVRLPTLEPGTQARLAELLPPVTFQQNPVDTGRPGTSYRDVIVATAADPQIDLVAVYGLTEPVIDLPVTVAAADLGEMPVVIGIDGPQREVEVGRGTAAKLDLPIMVGATPLAQGVAALVHDARARYLAGGALAQESQDPVLQQTRWDEFQAKELLDRLGVRTPRRRLCLTRDEVLTSLDGLAAPVVLKICVPEIVHKSDVGGVRVGLRTPGDLGVALDSMADLGTGPWLVEEMCESGPELVVGARRDPVFGPVVVVGVGGTSTEVYGDVAIVAVPATDRQLLAMTHDLAGRALIEGHRGDAAATPEQVSEVVQILGAILMANPHISEMEVNPLRVTSEGLVALDAVILSESPAVASTEQEIR